MTVIDLIRSQDLEGLKSRLEKEIRALDTRTEEGVWAVHEAIRVGNLEMVKYIMEYAIVNPNLRDEKGNQALHYGVESGNLELVKYLTERVGMSITYGNLDGETPLDRAVRLGQKEIQTYLEQRQRCCHGQMYHNPVRRGMYPDPSVVRVGEDYYMVNSTFMFFPCIPISHSRDLVHWETIGYAITRADWAGLDGLEGGRGYWAPDISFYEGRFYITATYRLGDEGKIKRLQMVTSSKYPQGPYCQPVFLDEDGIDPSIFTDRDGRRYMLLNRGARIFEISKDGKEILSKPRLLWYGDLKKASEGPHLLYKDGYYYLFMAEGGTGKNHRISVARSIELMGVYEPSPYNPILRQWDDQALIQCAGHGKPVDTPGGDWYMVYLCTRMPDGEHGILGRETALDPIRWTEDGWPVVNRLQGPSSQQKCPECSCGRNRGQREIPLSGREDKREKEFSEREGKKEEELSGREDNSEKEFFGREDRRQPKLPTREDWGDWCMPRGTDSPVFGRDKHGFWLKGDGTDLFQLEHRSTLLRRQNEFVFSINLWLEASSPGPEEDMGLTCYYDENSYMKFGIANRRGRQGIVAEEFVDDRYRSSLFLPDERNGCVQLKIETDFLKRTCFYRHGEEEMWIQAAVFEDTGYLCSEGLNKGKRFTGAMAGFYVHGKGTVYVRGLYFTFEKGGSESV